MKEMILKQAKAFWNDEDAQGMMEYILLAVLVVGALTLAGPKIKNMISDKADSLSSDVQSFDPDSF